MIRFSRALLVCFALFLLVGCRSANAPTTPLQAGEFKKFEGTWIVTAATIDGDDLPNQVGQEYTFAASGLTIRDGAKLLDTSKVVLDPSAEPKAIDLVSENLKPGEPSAQFIYRFDADELKLCRGVNDRPTSFAGKDQVVFTLKRKNR